VLRQLYTYTSIRPMHSHTHAHTHTHTHTHTPGDVAEDTDEDIDVAGDTHTPHMVASFLRRAAGAAEPGVVVAAEPGVVVAAEPGVVTWPFVVPPPLQPLP
jgi:hypothetical protein